MKRLMKVGEKYLFGFASQSCGFTGEIEFEGEVIDIVDGTAVVESDYFDRFWVNDAREALLTTTLYDKSPPYKVKRACDDIRVIKKLRK